MIYTSYFAQLRNLPSNIIPISICAKAPLWYTGLQYKKLAPKYDFFMEWKKNQDNDYYIKCFKEQVTDQLDVKKVVNELDEMMKQITGAIDFSIDPIFIPCICLICYEKPTDFCHRHLVAEWLNANGFECEEWRNQKS